MKLDLGYGNPGFLQELWKDHSFLNKLKSLQLMPYSFAKTNEINLEKEILKLHNHHKNVKITSQTKVVVSVGAVQALQAAMYALKQLKNTQEIFIPKPYWIRFNDFADLTGLRVSDSTHCGLSLVTSPNNPDGVDQSHMQTDIRDACYNWMHYTDDVKEFDDTVSVFSLSKLSGHSSTRIGWAIVQDESVAKLMQYYVNIITSGVSIEAQKNAAKIIKSINKNDHFLSTAKSTLVNRHNELTELIKKSKSSIKIISTQGMFFYIECDPSIIECLQIVCPPGSDFKDPNSNRFRLNIGCDESTFQTLLTRIAQL